MIHGSRDTKTTLQVLIAVCSLALPVCAMDIEAITARPTADNPRFDNEEAWSVLVGDEYFTKENWPEATRLLIWGLVDENGRSKNGDPRIAANWTDAATGKPAETLPDMDTDVIVPDSDQPYEVRAHRGDTSFSCRHLTVGRNATFRPAGGGNLMVFGNVWIRSTGHLFVYRKSMLVGGRDTFLRRDWPADGKLRRMHDERTIAPFMLDDPHNSPWSRRDSARGADSAHFFTHDKPEGSTEVVGFVMSRDECHFRSGTFIVGRDSRFLCGGAAQLSIGAQARIVLMDNATIAKNVNWFATDLVLSENGAITGGTQDRPIKRDARIGLGYRNWMNLDFGGDKNGRHYPYRYGKIAGAFTGDLIGYPAKGSNARLVVDWHRIMPGNKGRGIGENYEVYAKLKPKITIWIGAETKIENARFDDLHRGGIVVPDASAAAKWKNVTFGKGCLSKDPKELIREYKGKMNRGQPAEPLKPGKEYTSM